MLDRLAARLITLSQGHPLPLNTDEEPFRVPLVAQLPILTGTAAAGQQEEKRG